MKAVAFALVFITSLPAFVNEQKDNKAFNRLYPLQGKWIMRTGKGFIGEEWIKINDDYLQNRGYMIKGKDTIITERVALTNTKEGIFYTSTVEDQNNKQPIAFRLTAADDNTFVFENQQHDFPKRIVYKLITADSLHAWIDDGTETGKRQDFYYKRQK